MTDRIKTLSDNLPSGMDAVLITSEVSRKYLLGFSSSAGTLVIAGKTRCFIIDSRYFEDAEEKVKNCEIVLQEKLYEQIAGILKQHDAKTVGIEADKLSLTQYLGLKEKLEGFEVLESDFISRQIEKQRSVKSAEETENIQAAQDIADKTFTHILDFIKPDVSEREIAAELERYARSIGAEGMSFECIVAAGANSSRPHAVPSGNRLKRGDFVTLDFGCVKNGYCSDMTRTVAIGPVSGKQREVYDIVLSAQQSALSAVKPGVACSGVDKLARDIIDGTEYKGLFGHGLGHSLGLEVHESPSFSTESKAVLEEGMCMSVEPGIYIPGEFGVRIEDIVAVTESGYHNFCKSDKNLIII